VAVRIICDVCDELADPETWQGLTMTIPGELLGTFTGEELEIHVCSWKCVYILAMDKAGPQIGAMERQAERELERDQFEAAPIDNEREARAQQRAEEAAESAITWGNNPNAGLKQPDIDIPLGGITKDRQTIRLRKK
jgi:hypothetical protein